MFIAVLKDALIMECCPAQNKDQLHCGEKVCEVAIILIAYGL